MGTPSARAGAPGPPSHPHEHTAGCHGLTTGELVSNGRYEPTAAPPPYRLAREAEGSTAVHHFCERRHQPWQQYEWTVGTTMATSPRPSAAAAFDVPTSNLSVGPSPPAADHGGLRPFASLRFCDALRNRSVLFVGDSTQAQMFDSLTFLARGEAREAQPLGVLEGVLRAEDWEEPPCVESPGADPRAGDEEGVGRSRAVGASPPPSIPRWQCAAVRLCGGSARVAFIRNDHLLELPPEARWLNSTDATGWTAASVYYPPMHMPFLARARDADVVILNRGVHYVDDTTLQAQTSALAQELARAARQRARSQPGRPAQRLFWRTSVPGHANCTSRSTLLPKPYVPPPGYGDHSRGAAAGDQSAPPGRQYGWEHVAGQNALVRTALEAKLGGAIEFLDAARLSNRRADRHALWGGSATVKDCLHYCSPGPVDDWNALLAHALLCGA